MYEIIFNAMIVCSSVKQIAVTLGLHVHAKSVLMLDNTSWHHYTFTDKLGPL